MTTRSLIGAVLAIALSTTALYAVISPIAREEMNAGITKESQSIVTSESRDERKDDYEERGDDKEEDRDRDDRFEEGDDRDRNGNEEERATPPVASVRPAPTPTPASEPNSSGFTLADVAKHSDASSCWTAVNGSVYDVTSFISKHPGGERNILRICGRDGTSLFEGQHGGDTKPEARLASFRIGALIQ